MNPFVVASDEITPASKYINEKDFAAIHAAAEFAADFTLWLDTTVTITWTLMDVQGATAVEAQFAAFMKCLNDWLVQRQLPVAWLYSHEMGRKVGLHTHITLYLPGAPSSLRRDFRSWIRRWPDRHFDRAAPRAIRVRGPAVETPWLHWVTTSYLLKGYQPSLVVQSRRNAPDGQDVFLGDLIAWPWRDPGPVALKKRVGLSRSLGPDRRQVGFPSHLGLLSELRIPRHLTGMPRSQILYPPFRSTYEDGIRDVSRLYPQTFYKMILEERWAPPS